MSFSEQSIDMSYWTKKNIFLLLLESEIQPDKYRDFIFDVLIVSMTTQCGEGF